jgi:tRNA uridine 5-carboxymethylaminomethyl modification enzyme
VAEAAMDLDVVVVGAGHAGCEAALAAARLGCRTALLTISLDTIAQMSCNPAIGGLAKGQMVREIDALGGEMGLVADATGIQFRMLNRGKGPAVFAPRAQADRRRYAAEMKRRLEAQPGLLLRQDVATALETERGRVTGVRGASGVLYRTRAAVITAGTFLRGELHIGAWRGPGGRLGEPAAEHLSAALVALGFTLGRLKTGTPPRVNGRTVDFDRMQRQDGDAYPQPFSFRTESLPQRQVPCWITRTTPATRTLILANLDRAPLYTGQIQAVGPRYCPSVETKVQRFADKESHQVFVEPEGLDTHEMYLNGLSTSLPTDVQEAMVHSVPGLERAEIMRYGYAIEYDFAPPTQLLPSLAAKRIENLFFAGQINGTSGYEEAAGQGLLAGINAARLCRGEDPLVLDRAEAYLGVMIDDLVTRGTSEPYRMFTSRAEYRLLLRQDNADRRLMPHGRALGLIDDDTWRRFQQKEALIAGLRRYLATHRRDGHTLEELLRRPEVRLRVSSGECRMSSVEHRVSGVEDATPAGDARRDTPPVIDIPADFLNSTRDTRHSTFRSAVEEVEIEVKYGGYIEHQEREVARFRAAERRGIPAGVDYGAVPHLRAEARQKLAALEPRSLGQAARIEGIAPADIDVLSVYLDACARRGRDPGPEKTLARSRPTGV